MRVFVEGIGIVGPGLEGWPSTRAVLAGTRPVRSHGRSARRLPDCCRLRSGGGRG